LYAQIPLNFGFKGGISLNQYSNDIDSISQENATGWQGGLQARIKLDKWYVGADALFTSKPGKFTTQDGKTEGKIQVMGVDVPLVLGYKVIKTKLFNLRMFAGPTMHFNFYDKVKTSYEGGSFETNDNWKINRNPQFSLAGGAGIDIAFMTLDFNYLYGLSNWSDDINMELKNQGFQVNIGFKIL
jgi:hypothetical protein